MGIEHRFKEGDKLVRRCPICEHLSTDLVQEEVPYVSFFAGMSGEYFRCNNPKCEVDRIYDFNCVTIGDD